MLEMNEPTLLRMGLGSMNSGEKEYSFVMSEGHSHVQVGIYWNS